MKIKYLATLVALSIPMMTNAAENETADKDAKDIEVISVTGIRGSMASSAALKRNSSEVMDSITAEDIGKLPDPNVAETLTRIPGVQGYRYGGEGASPVGAGSGLTIRGLSNQTASHLNGRTYFTAGSREFNIEGAMPGMIAGIDVYKSPSAKHIEGGIGGLIDIRTRSPLAMEADSLTVSTTARYNDFTKDVEPELFGLYSNNWELSDGGKMGFLFAANHQKTHNRSDSNPTNRGTALRRAVRADSAEYLTLDGADQSYVGQSDVWYLANAEAGDNPADLITTSTKDAHVFEEDIFRERQGYNAVFEWQVNDRFKAYAEGNFNKYTYHQEYRFLIMNGDSRTVKNLETFDYTLDEQLQDRNANGGANEIISEQAFAAGTFLNSRFFGLGGNEDHPYQTWMIAAGFDWDITDNLTMNLDFSHVKADQSVDNRNIALQPKAGLTWDVTRDLTTEPHQIAIAGPSLADANNFVFGDYSNGANRSYDDDADALKVDFIYSLDRFINSVEFGARYATINTHYNDYSFGGKHLTTDGLALAGDQSNGISVASMPGFYELAHDDWFKGQAGYTGGFVTPSPSGILGDQVRGGFVHAGIERNSNLKENLASRRVASEDSFALYAVANFATADDRIRGDFGVRIVGTDVEATAWVADINGGSSPVARTDTASDTQILPSFNIVGEIQEDLLVRFGYSRGLTRPGFAQLNPTLTVNQAAGTASIGNPGLEALTADSFDISLEKYFDDTAYVSVAVFDKEIDGFINTLSSCEAIDGVAAYSGVLDNNCTGGLYNVSRQVNAESGYARGIEVAGQTFFDGLPGIWSHFGVAASYTHVKTSNPVKRGGVIVDTPQPYQSEDSYNISGLYEDGDISARIVYSYRSDFILFGVNDSPANGRYAKGYGLIDASVNYTINDTYALSFNASNLTDEAPSRYIGEPGSGTTDLQNQYYLNGRNFALTLRATF